MKLSTKLRNNLVGTLGFAATFANGYIEIYSGAQPATADSAVAGTLLGTITLNSGAFTPGVSTNGLTFAAAASGAVSKSGVWSFNGVANGTAGWFRLKTNAEGVGGAADPTFLFARLDGTIAVTGADLNLSNIAVATGMPNTVDTFTWTQPAS